MTWRIAYLFVSSRRNVLQYGSARKDNPYGIGLKSGKAAWDLSWIDSLSLRSKFSISFLRGRTQQHLVGLESFIWQPSFPRHSSYSAMFPRLCFVLVKSHQLALVLATKWEVFELSHFYHVELDPLYRWIRSFISWGVFWLSRFILLCSFILHFIRASNWFDNYWARGFYLDS